jgi:hypothetical protein
MRETFIYMSTYLYTTLGICFPLTLCSTSIFTFFFFSFLTTHDKLNYIEDFREKIKAH